MDKVCIIVLNYNNGLKTVSALKSILGQSVDNHSVAVVDNCSTDDSIEIISSYFAANDLNFSIIQNESYQSRNNAHFPRFAIIQAEKNGGYSYGNNIGIRYARSLNIFSHLLIINNDVILPSDFLECMLSKYHDLQISSNDKKIAMGATELSPDGILNHHGFHYLHIPTSITFFKPVWPCFKYIVGSCIFLDIDAPLMDESFFLYFDDIQYSKILLRQGYLLFSNENSAYIHEVGGSESSDLNKLLFEGMRMFYSMNYRYLLPFIMFERSILNYWLKIKKYFHGL
ncbi:MAG: glycosyltransferase family 2 protein [Bacteroidota bacterium]|jgi:GT2 family glycosyltransferase